MARSRRHNRKVIVPWALLNMDYQWLGVVNREVENAGGQRLSMDYGQRVQILAYFRPARAETLTVKITELTAAQVIMNMGDFVYI